MTQLHMVSELARTRKLRVREFWRQLGMASADRDSVTHTAPHKCPLCLTSATVFFRIQPLTGPASQKLVDTLKQERISRLSQLLKERGLEQAQTCDNKLITQEGVHLCFGCAIKSIPDLKNIEDSDVGVTKTNSLHKRPKHSHITPPQELLRDLPACSSSAIESPQLH